MESNSQDHEDAINIAQTEFRDALNARNTERAMAVIAEFFVWMRDGEPSYWGREGRQALRLWIVKTFQTSHLQMIITPDCTNLYGDNALSRGWEILEERNAEGQTLSRTSFRYFQTWTRSAEHGWVMSSFICNRDVTPRMLPE